MRPILPLNLSAFWVALACATLLCILCLDRSVVLFFAAHDGLRRVFQACAAPSLLALPAAGLFLCWAALQKLSGVVRLNPLWLRVSLATLAATAAKDELKWLFGRPWPETWLKHGLYSFHPLANSALYGGFPSGHTAYISAPLGVLWVLRPRWRPLYAAVILGVMTGLVGANYHFLSDVLGGLITGTACAWGTLVLLGPEKLHGLRAFYRTHLAAPNGAVFRVARRAPPV